MDDITLEEYLQDKKKHPFRGKNYYKLKNYSASYYVEDVIVESLEEGRQDVKLERNSKFSASTINGIIKWDPVRGKILLTEDRVRTHYKIFEIE